MENLYDYYLHYNIYTEEWNAFSREENYMGGTKKKKTVYSNRDLNKLIDEIKNLEFQLV
jgi:hypothetical protein